MTKANDFKGYALFSDIDDATLRNRNRAVVLANLAQDHIDRKSKKVSIKGAALILGYFGEVAEDDRKEVVTRFQQNMVERGFALVS